MKEIPNKIYIDEDLINYHCLTYRCDGDLEYVRKDALLEWAKETYLNENASAIRKVCYKQLIDKIESL